MPDLFPTGYDSDIYDIETNETEDQKATGYKKSIYFDFEKGDFLRTGTYRLVESSGIDTWLQWCIKCLHTQRYAHLAYSTDYGIDYESIFTCSTREEAETELHREITEALHADPLERLHHIESITFNWMDDTAVEVSIVLVGIEGNTAEITTTLPVAA